MMIRGRKKERGEKHAVLCFLMQGSAARTGVKRCSILFVIVRVHAGEKGGRGRGPPCPAEAAGTALEEKLLPHLLQLKRTEHATGKGRKSIADNWFHFALNIKVLKGAVVSVSKKGGFSLYTSAVERSCGLAAAEKKRGGGGGGDGGHFSSIWAPRKRGGEGG